MGKDILKLISKVTLLLIPLWVLIFIYASDDPFKVLYKYQDYYGSNKLSIPLNRDFVATEIFKENYQKYRYDSYIFGSSKSLAFLCSDWNTHIGKNPFHFDANGESLPGILDKLEYLDRNGASLENCIIVLDSGIISNIKYLTGQQYIKHPETSGQSRVDFQYEFLTTFLSNRYFIPYLALKYDIEIPEFFEYDAINESREFLYDSVNNDTRFISLEEEIQKDSNLYYQKYQSVFFKRDTLSQRYSSVLIGPVAEKQLAKISDIFRKHKTNIRIVLYPVFNQAKINSQDLKKLAGLFGKENVFDFSGINNITNNIHNYYESEHCRPRAGKWMLSEMYK